MASRTHYDVLGVARDAPAGVIRERYRDLAREFHPDRVVGSAARTDRMPEINQAYHVLSDPARRAVYDAELRSPSTTRAGAGPHHRTDEDVHVDPDLEWRRRQAEQPARVPWRTILVATVIAIAGVVILAQFTETTEPAGPNNITQVGDCVEITDQGMAREVLCSGSGSQPVDGDLVIRNVVPFDADCPFGLEQRQDRQGMGLVCLEQL